MSNNIFVQREALLGILIEADMKAVEKGFAVAPMNRLRVDAIVDMLIARGVVVVEKGATDERSD